MEEVVPRPRCVRVDLVVVGVEAKPGASRHTRTAGEQARSRAQGSAVARAWRLLRVCGRRL